MKTVLYAELDEGDYFAHPLTGYTYRKTGGLMCDNVDIGDEQQFKPDEKVVLLDEPPVDNY